MLPLVEREWADGLPGVLRYDAWLPALARPLAYRWSRPTVRLFPYIASNESFRRSRGANGANEIAETHTLRTALVNFLSGNGFSEKDPPKFALSATPAPFWG